ncbi:DUF2666 domain-containing protein [Thermococcus peptonophilus]|uniref:DUF2666 domain-containing protein n=1 Tax=Thermococcus peptonophilus TaxID=53952 RepID=A0A142CWS0_9EURY|nr:DUF2666 domain-containing protein [Thermococcus peptonophilus]AMQ19222.1 hypothetical protein A0127_08615 [Thermococcus peptonophilus]
MRIEEHVAFTAKHNDWQVAKKLTELEDEAVAHFLAGIANSVNTRIPHYMSENIDLEGIRRLAEEVRKDTLSDTIVALKSPGTSRKLGALVKEGDKKLKKLLVDAAKAVLVRITLEEIVPVNYPEGELTGVDVEFPYEEDHVNFTAKHGKWIVVKRLIIDEKTPLLDVARLLASINETVTLKLPAYAHIDLEGIEGEFSAFKKVKKSDIPKVVEAYEAFEPSAYADEPFLEHARVYALRVALEKIGLPLDVPSKSLEKYLEKA